MSNCLDNKPEATPFSNEINAMVHDISIAQGAQMISNFEAVRETMLAPEYQGSDTHLLSETFNLQTIHNLLTQPNAVGLRIYMGMDDNQKTRLILVGVDSDGQDIIQRYRQNPGGEFRSGDFSIMVEESGQRWP